MHARPAGQRARSRRAHRAAFRDLRAARSGLLPACLLAAAAAAPSTSAARGMARYDRIERAVVRIINERRSEAGLRPLALSRRLARPADRHSWRMLAADSFGHGRFDRRIRRYVRARIVGETIAVVPRSTRGQARRIVAMWMDSPPHRAQLMSPRYARVGVARRRGAMGGRSMTAYTADFASSG